MKDFFRNIGEYTLAAYRSWTLISKVEDKELRTRYWVIWYVLLLFKCVGIVYAPYLVSRFRTSIPYANLLTVWICAWYYLSFYFDKVFLEYLKKQEKPE